MQKFALSTDKRDAFVDITPQVRRAIKESGVENGICTIYCPHTTAAITINENADPDVPRDIIVMLDQVIPHRAAYRHSEGNSAAHIKSSLVGCFSHVIVEDNQPVLGTWQSVFFCEFDGPRQRRFLVEVVSS
jgi:secondary thiamine-phosphate synthase enzyme